MGELASFVDANTFVTVFIVVLIIAYFVWKNYPEFKQRMAGPAAQDASNNADLAAIKEEVRALKGDVREIKDKINRDYERLNRIEEETRAQQQRIDDSLEERELLMKGILACLDGLEQQGCNHSVPQTKTEINDFLNRQSHRR